MRQTDQQPFAFDLRQPAQHELAEAANVFDLSKDWFDDRLATVVNLASRSAFQFVPHLRPHTGVERRASGTTLGSGSLGGTYKSIPRKASVVITALLK